MMNTPFGDAFIHCFRVGLSMMSDSKRRLVVEGGEKIVDFDNKAFKPIPEEGIEMAANAMRRGVMYRYQPKTKEGQLQQISKKKFAEFMGVKHAVGGNSCGSTMFIAMNIAGVKAGDKILSNAFTFHAVPSVIEHMRAEPVLVESNREWECVLMI